MLGRTISYLSVQRFCFYCNSPVIAQERWLSVLESGKQFAALKPCIVQALILQNWKLQEVLLRRCVSGCLKVFHTSDNLSLSLSVSLSLFLLSPSLPHSLPSSLPLSLVNLLRRGLILLTLRHCSENKMRSYHNSKSLQHR